MMTRRVSACTFDRRVLAPHPNRLPPTPCDEVAPAHAPDDGDVLDGALTARLADGAAGRGDHVTHYATGQRAWLALRAVLA